MVRVCRRTAIMGWITLLLCAVRDSAASPCCVLTRGVPVGRAPCQGCAQVSSGGAHQDSRVWGSTGSEDLQAVLLKGTQHTAGWKGHHVLLPEQDFSPWTLLSVNGTNSLKSLLLDSFPPSLYLLIRLFHWKRAGTEIL